MPDDKNHRSVRIFLECGKYYIVDGFDPKTNTIYEFHGDYWHGNPKRFEPNKLNKRNGFTFGELFKKTLDRENMLRSLGYNLEVMWESDFKGKK